MAISQLHEPALTKLIITLFAPPHPPRSFPPQTVGGIVTKPFEEFIAFMSSKNYVEPENGGKYGATAAGGGESKVDEGGDDAGEDDGGDDDDDDEDEEDEDDDEDED